MTAPDATSPAASTAPVASWRESLSVYLQPRVLIVLFLGFSSGLPLALSGSTLLVWMADAGVDLGTIGLFARCTYRSSRVPSDVAAGGWCSRNCC